MRTSRPQGDGACCRRPRSLNSLRDVVDDYLAEYRTRDWVAFHQNDPSLDLVASWKDAEGRVYSHQSRVPRVAKRKAAARIRALDLEVLRGFEDLIQRVKTAIGHIPGIGDLAVYDVATRIGAGRDVWPQRVYVHAGVRKGVRALGLDANQRSLSFEVLPRELRRLEPWQVEDLLCIYGPELAGIGRRQDRVA